MIKIALFVSSLTGNTERIAKALQKQLIHLGYEVSIQDCCEIRMPLTTADFYVLCFWTRRGSLDPDSFKLLMQYKNTPFIAIGTCGHYPDSEYGWRIKSYIKGVIDCSNQCLGVFLSQGAVSLESTRTRRNLPKTRPHYLNDEGYARHLESQNHPDEADISNALNFLLQYLPTLPV